MRVRNLPTKSLPFSESKLLFGKVTFLADLVTLKEEILNGILEFWSSDASGQDKILP